MYKTLLDNALYPFSYKENDGQISTKYCEVIAFSIFYISPQYKREQRNKGEIEK